MEEEIELILVVNSERVIGEKLLMEASRSFVRIGEDKLLFLEEKISLDSLGKAVEKKGEVKSFYTII